MHFLDTVFHGLPNVSFVDPEFALADNGTGADDHPKADIRRGERFIADTYHALADTGDLNNTVLVITFDEGGGFYDHVRPPQVIDDTDPATETMRATAQRRPTVVSCPTTPSSGSGYRPSWYPTSHGPGSPARAL